MTIETHTKTSLPEEIICGICGRSGLHNLAAHSYAAHQIENNDAYRRELSLDPSVPLVSRSWTEHRRIRASEPKEVERIRQTILPLIAEHHKAVESLAQRGIYTFKEALKRGIKYKLLRKIRANKILGADVCLITPNISTVKGGCSGLPGSVTRVYTEEELNLISNPPSPFARRKVIVDQFAKNGLYTVGSAAEYFELEYSRVKRAAEKRELRGIEPVCLIDPYYPLPSKGCFRIPSKPIRLYFQDGIEQVFK